MTVSTQTSSITYIGNASTTLFTFPFIGVQASDIIVTYTAIGGTETVLNPSVYTLVLNAPATGQLWGIGGSVTYPISGTPIPIGSFLTINRVVPFTQNTSIINQGAFYPQAVEQALDLLELQLQQTQTQADFAIQCPIVDQAAPNVLPPAAERASKLLGFDNFGQTLLYIPGSASPIATSSSLGSVQPDDKTIFINGSGIISANGGFNLNILSTGSTTHSFAAAGNLITPQYNLRLYTVNALLTTVTGGVYQIGIAPYNTSTNEITSAPAYAPSFTEITGVANKWVNGVFGTNAILLNAGTTYVIFIVRTDSTTTASTTLNTNTAVGAISPGIYQVVTNNSVHLASTGPTTSQTWTTETGFYTINLLYQFA